VAHDDASVDRLPAAAAQARRINGRLLVAVAQPRGGFTTDAAIARFAARRTDKALLRREREVQRLLGGSGVDWATVRMPFWDSTSVTRRARRLATAAKRLVRRRGVAALPAVLQAAPISLANCPFDALWRVLGERAPVRFRLADGRALLAERGAGLGRQVGDRPLLLRSGACLLHVPHGGLDLLGRGHQRPTARSSSALFILERPSMFFSRASL